MTEPEVMSVRFSKPGTKRKLQEQARPNPNAWLSQLVERELGGESGDWRDILKGDRPSMPDDIYESCLKPE
jgi:hypothetical protein